MFFIAGVGNASLFDGDKLVATANTLIDSGITIGITMEDIRGGVSNKLLGRYGHDSQFSLKLTDAMFSLEYIAMNTGSEVELGGNCIYNEKIAVDNTGCLSLEKTPKPFFGSVTKVYAKPMNSSGSYQAYDLEESGNKIKVMDTAPTSVDPVYYCVRYMYENKFASKIVINSDFIPKTLSVVLEANLYSGGSCDDTSNATIAGKIVIKVPRFMLNGSQEIAMTATRAAQTSLEGMALSSGCNSCDGAGVYAEILQVLANASEDMFAELVIEDASKYKTVKVGTKIPVVVYACPNDGAPIKLKADQFTITADGTVLTYTAGNDYVLAATAGNDGEITVTSKIDGTASTKLITELAVKVEA